jgi:hypothetical protein
MNMALRSKCSCAMHVPRSFVVRAMYTAINSRGTCRWVEESNQSVATTSEWCDEHVQRKGSRWARVNSTSTGRGSTVSTE